ncbi:MAG: hypothetical protein ACP5N2_03385 [Candidatus Nanoarchaeia archaeon]
MFVKRGVGVKLFFALVFFVASLSVIVFAETGYECTAPGNALSACIGSSTIFDSGWGAVELCGVCHKCGVADGVCPEYYSDGRNESTLSTDKRTVFMRTKRATMIGDEYTVAFQTGRLACTAIGGNCSLIQRFDGSSWITFSSTNCITNFSSSNSNLNETVRALCTNVPRKSNCEFCPDPDCVASLKGKTYDSNTGIILEGVNVSAKKATNPLLSLRSNISDNQGNYQVLVVTGRLEITCAKETYQSYVSVVTLQPGNNIFDCYMNNLTCTASCTTINNAGVEVCQPSCNGQSGCLMSDEAITRCANSPPGTMITINSTIYTNPVDGCDYNNLTRLTCCSGALTNSQSLILGSCGDPPPPPPGGCVGSECDIIEGGLFAANVSSIITRNYRKELNGFPVTLKIIVYKK